MLSSAEQILTHAKSPAPSGDSLNTSPLGRNECFESKRRLKPLVFKESLYFFSRD